MIDRLTPFDAVSAILAGINDHFDSEVSVETRYMDIKLYAFGSQMLQNVESALVQILGASQSSGSVDQSANGIAFPIGYDEATTLNIGPVDRIDTGSSAEVDIKQPGIKKGSL